MGGWSGIQGGKQGRRGGNVRDGRGRKGERMSEEGGEICE